MGDARKKTCGFKWLRESRQIQVFKKKHAKTAKYKKEALGTARGVGKRGLWFFALAPDREVPYTSIP